MAGQAILGDTVLKSAMAMEAAAPTIETLVADHSRMVFRIKASQSIMYCFVLDSPIEMRYYIVRLRV
ncbi:MAG: hypothetical protein ACXV7C_00335 [Candidatus Angelobacter sp.]